MLFSSTECISWLSVGVTECVAVLVISLVTSVVFIKNRNLRRRSLYLVLDTAVADMLVGGLSIIHLFAMLSFFCNHRFYGSISLSGEMVILFLFYFGPLSSILNITVISLERLHATFCPFRHRFTKNWVYGVTIAVIWIVAAAVSASLTVLSKVVQLESYHYFWQSFNLICLFIICVSYATIVIKMHCSAHPHHHGAVGRERKLTMTLLIVTVVSLLLYLPNAIGTLLYYTTDTITSLPFLTARRINYALILLYYANSLVNPLVYAIRMPDFKRALFSIFGRQQRENEVFHLRPL